MSNFIEPHEEWEEFKEKLKEWSPGSYEEDDELVKVEMEDGYIYASEDKKMVVDSYNKRQRKLEGVEKVRFETTGQLKIMVLEVNEDKSFSTTSMRFSWPK